MKVKLLFFIFISISFSLTKGQNKKGILVLQNNEINMPSSCYIKEIRIKRGVLKQSKNLLIHKAMDSTLFYKGNCLSIVYIDENEARQVSKNNKNPDYLIADVYDLANADEQRINEQVAKYEQRCDSIKNDRKYNEKYIQPSGDKLYLKDSASKLEILLAKNIRVGIGYGPEVFISGMIPKVSYISFMDKKKVKPYYGTEINLWLADAFWLSNNYLYGIKKELFTLEMSVGYWWCPKQLDEDCNNYFHSTFTPKLGMKFWKLWFKVGTAFPLYKNYSEEIYGGDVRGGNTALNFEILFFPN